MEEGLAISQTPSLLLEAMRRPMRRRPLRWAIDGKRNKRSKEEGSPHPPPIFRKTIILPNGALPPATPRRLGKNRRENPAGGLFGGWLEPIKVLILLYIFGTLDGMNLARG
jgi:hypothetical protein